MFHVRKSQPTPSDVHVNQPLTNISIAWLQSQDEFIADRAFRIVPVQKQSDRYYVYNRPEWFRAKATVRAPGTAPAGSGYTLKNSDTYFADVYAIAKDIDDQVRANADSVLNLDREATEFVSRDLVLKKEVVWASDFFKTGVWTGSTTGSDVSPAVKWDTVGATPIKDMRAQLTATKRRTGFRANVAIMGEEVYRALEDSPDFIERIKFTQTAIVGKDLLASVLGLEEILVGGGVQNTAIENANGTTETMSYIFGDNCLLLYRPASPGLMTPAAGYTFSWVGLLGSSANGGRVLRQRLDEIFSDRVIGEMSWDHKAIEPLMGAFLSDCLASV